MTKEEDKADKKRIMNKEREQMESICEKIRVVKEIFHKIKYIKADKQRKKFENISKRLSTLPEFRLQVIPKRPRKVQASKWRLEPLS